MTNNEKSVKVRIACGALSVFLATSSIIAINYPKTVYAETVKYPKSKHGTFIDIDPTSEYIYYIVKEGDNASSISRAICRYFHYKPVSNIFWPVVAKKNNYPRTIQPGEPIRVYRDMQKTIDELDNINKDHWIAKYKKLVKQRKAKKAANAITVGDVVDTLYGIGTSDNPLFVAQFIESIGLDPNAYKSDTTLSGADGDKVTRFVQDKDQIKVVQKKKKKKGK